MSFSPSAQTLFTGVSRFPWRGTALTLRDRFREDRMGVTASSLTFTTIIALVPFFTVALALFTAFPMFAKLQGALQGWLIQSLIPDNIARQVLGYLTLFSRQAHQLGIAGLAFLTVTATALILTIDRTLNGIWRVEKQRSLPQRVLIYWAAITLGPLLMAASLALTSYALSATAGLVGALPASVRLLLDLLQFLLVAGSLTALYRYVPNTHVKWFHAFAGGVFAAAGIALAKKALAIYLGNVPTYSLIYGAFATLPILLVWIYVAWIIVLLGAVIAAYLPSLVAGVSRRGSVHGWHFQLAVELLQQLHGKHSNSTQGLDADALARALQVDVLQIQPVLEVLTDLQWVGKLVEEDGAASRYVLLADPETTRLEPLMQRLLLEKSPSLQKLWEKASWPALCLRDML